MRRLALLAPLILTACAETPPVATLAPPDLALTFPCPDLPEIPKNDGNRDVRKLHYSEVRALYAQCRDKHTGLIRYAQVVSTPKP